MLESTGNPWKAPRNAKMHPSIHHQGVHFILRRRGDLNPRWSCAPHFISSEAHSAALARLQHWLR